jgi:hypothetical protein
MERRTPTVSDVVRRAVEVCDPDDVDPALGALVEQLEDDDWPVTTVDNLEEHLAVALERAGVDQDDPAVAVAAAVVLYLASKGGLADHDRDPGELIRLAVRAQWRGDPPTAVAEWVAGREA